MAETFIPLRVFYEKTGRMRYISHLDMNRCISRILKRSGLPVWYTQGFHPHIYVTFALPLSLGFSGEQESFDFRLTNPVSAQDVKDRLNALLPPGLFVGQVSSPVHKPEAIASALYQIQLLCENPVQAQTIRDEFLSFCERTEILAEKHSKKGKKIINIRPHFSLLEMDVRENTLLFLLKTDANTSINLNPRLVLDSFSGTDHRPLWEICRKAILDHKGNPFT